MTHTTPGTKCATARKKKRIAQLTIRRISVTGNRAPRAEITILASVLELLRMVGRYPLFPAFYRLLLGRMSTCRRSRLLEIGGRGRCPLAERMSTCVRMSACGRASTSRSRTGQFFRCHLLRPGTFVVFPSDGPRPLFGRGTTSSLPGRGLAIHERLLREVSVHRVENA